MQAVIDGGDSPDLILFPQNYEGRDAMARLSVKLDRTVLTNNVDIAVDGDQVRGDDAGVRRQHVGHHGVHRWRSVPGRVSAEVVRGRAGRVAGGGRGGGGAGARISGPPARREVVASHVEESTGPKLDEANVVVSGGRGLGEAGKFEMIEQLARVAEGRGRRLAGDRRRRLGAVLDAGRPDRQGRQAQRLHRRAASRVRRSTWSA